MTRHVHGNLREALERLPLAWPANMGPRERRLALENLVIAIDSLATEKAKELEKKLQHERDVREGAAWR